MKTSEICKVLFGFLSVAAILLTLALMNGPGQSADLGYASSAADAARTDLRLTEITAALDSIIYVDQDATGADDGSSWADAYTDLQDALSVATYGDEIWVAVGVYVPGDLRGMSFQLKSGVGLYGGFGGTETARDQRDWEAHVTVLSGDIGGNDITNADGVVTDPDDIQGDNSYHVIKSVNVAEIAILDGFTVTAGDTGSYGGGMYTVGSDPTLTNVTFSGNQAWWGGAMYNYGSDPTLTNVTFSGNEATESGGGMYNTAGSDPTLTKVTFSGNEAPYFGGGMINEVSSPTLTDVTFSDNRAPMRSGGGMENFDNSNPTLINVTFTGNYAYWGGGMSNFNGSDPTLTDVTFIGNTASNSGGGMWNGGGCDSTLTNVIFSGNETVSEDGGGIYNEAEPVLTNVIFSGNYANDDGGAMFNRGGGDATLINVTVSGNHAGGVGGGIYNSSSSPTLSNCIVWWNGSGSTNRTSQIDNSVGSAAILSHSLVQGEYSITGNLYTDPQFVLPVDHTTAPTTAGNLRLLPSSPAIDAGDNSDVPVEVTTDLDGNRRFVDIPDVVDTGAGTPPIVDIGAYEIQPDLAIAKHVTPATTVVPGETIAYVMTFSNTGTYSATGVLITDHVPSLLTGVSVMNSGAIITDTGASPAYVWQVQALSPGVGGVITLTGVVSPGLTTDTCFSNTATTALEGGAAVYSSTVPVTVKLPRVAFSGATYRVAESGSTALISVTLSPAPLVTVTVNYATADGSAIVGEDYSAAGGTLTFTPGIATQTFSVLITDDDVSEGNETVALSLSNPSYATLGAVNLATLTIIDDDGVIYLPLVVRNTP